MKSWAPSWGATPTQISISAWRSPSLLIWTSFAPLAWSTTRTWPEAEKALAPMKVNA